MNFPPGSFSLISPPSPALTELRHELATKGAVSYTPWRQPPIPSPELKFLLSPPTFLFLTLLPLGILRRAALRAAIQGGRLLPGGNHGSLLRADPSPTVFLPYHGHPPCPPCITELRYEQLTKGAVYCLEAIGSRLLAGVNNKLQCYEWMPQGRLGLKAEHCGHILVLYAQVRIYRN